MSDRSVIVTGGAGALGGAVSAAFLTAGWRVVVPVRRPDAPLVSGAQAVRANLTDEAAVAEVVSVAASDTDAPLRAVVNLVGGFSAGGPVHESTPAEFERMFTLNLRPTYLVTRAALPALLDTGSGSIVCVSSRAATTPFAGAAGYIAAKAAVLAFATAVATEYGGRGVRCNTILPGVIDTPANRSARPGADRSRWVAPARIAEVIRFLASPESEPVNGAAVPV